MSQIKQLIEMRYSFRIIALLCFIVNIIAKDRAYCHGYVTTVRPIARPMCYVSKALLLNCVGLLLNGAGIET